jgi:hypothetical protein
MTTIFRFPNGAAIDLSNVWSVSRILHRTPSDTGTKGVFNVWIVLNGSESSYDFILSRFETTEEELLARAAAEVVQEKLIKHLEQVHQIT